MNAIIDVGGGQRGIYGAGVFDRLLDEGIEFGCCIGVSAGSANIASYLAKQKGRNYRFYSDYASRKEYMSLSNFRTQGSYIDLNFVYSVLTDSTGEDPIDYRNLHRYGGKFLVVATENSTGRPHYFENKDIGFDNYRVFHASSTLPVVCNSCVIDGERYYDGGISDPVPIDKAFEVGCDKAVVILTRPVDFRNNGKIDNFCAKVIRKNHPKISECLKVRHILYNQSIDRLVELEKQGKCLIVSPDDCCSVNTLSTEKRHLDMLYKKGYNDARKIIEYVH